MKEAFITALIWIFFIAPVLGGLLVGIWFFVLALMGGLTQCPPRALC